MVLPVEMRSSPTTNVTGTFYTYDGDLIFDSTSANILGSFNSTRNIEIDYSVSGGSTTIGRAAVLYDYELASDTFTFDSELS
jgi:CO dehydrogenase/acetyl-CoA synthase gamma subunit (corrinoid Fe-S protein)